MNRVALLLFMIVLMLPFSLSAGNCASRSDGEVSCEQEIAYYRRSKLSELHEKLGI